MFGTLIVAGPRARQVLQPITDADVSNSAFPWLSARSISIGSIRAWALRINYAGELGWELHIPTEHMRDVYERLLRVGAAHDLRHFGLYALDSLRIDKCYRGWKSDLESGYSPLEASLDRFVDFEKRDFVGREALCAERKAGPRYRFVPLVLDEAANADAPYCSSVLAGSQRVGTVTSGVFSHTLGRSVALAYVRTQDAQPGTRLTIDVLGEHRGATVEREPLFDPENLRPRA